MESKLIINDHCFACGKMNDSGLKLKIRRSDDPEGPKKSVCRFIIEKTFQGYGGIIHGGVLSTVLDELMIYALFYQDIPTVTAKIEVTYKKKVMAGETLQGQAWMTRDMGKMVEAQSIIWNSGNEVVAKASGLFAKVDSVIRR